MITIHVPRWPGFALSALLVGPACAGDSMSGDAGETEDETSTSSADGTVGDPAGDDGVDDGVDDPGDTVDGDTVDGDTSDTGVDHGAIVMLEISPADVVLELDIAESAAQAYTVVAHYEDDAQIDVSDVADFESSNGIVGSMDGASLEIDGVLAIPGPSEVFAATTIVTATLDGQEAQAQLTIAVRAEDVALLIVPDGDPRGPVTESVELETTLDHLDTLMNIDVTGSMGGPINNVRSSLTTDVIPGIQMATDDPWFGVGAFADYPISPFGTANCFSATGTPYNMDQPFLLMQAVTDDDTAVAAAANALVNASAAPIGCGSDGPEALIESVYQIATGAGLNGPAPTMVLSNIAGVGGVEFREGALPLVVNVTDNQTHDPGVPICGFASDYDTNASVLAVAATRDETHLALDAICARVATVATSNFDPNCGPLADGVTFAGATQTLVHPDAWDLLPGGRPAGCAAGQCCTGEALVGVDADADGLCPLVYRVPFTGTGSGAAIVDAGFMTANAVPLSVVGAAEGLDVDADGGALPSGMASTAELIADVVPASVGTSPIPAAPAPVVGTDQFDGVVPGTPVVFDVTASNSVAPGLDVAQVFAVSLTATHDGCADLDQRAVYVLVPPAPLGG